MLFNIFAKKRPPGESYSNSPGGTVSNSLLFALKDAKQGHIRGLQELQAAIMCQDK